MHKVFLLAIIWAIHIAVSADEQTQDEFVITYFDNPQMPVLIDILQKSYESIGINPIFKSFPITRGLRMLEQGQVDADVVRNIDVLSNFDNVIPIETVLVSVDLLLLCKKEMSVCSDEAFENDQETMGVYIYNLDSVKKKYGERLKIKTLKNPDATDAIYLMQKGRINYALHPVIKGNVPKQISDSFNYVKVLDITGVHVVNKRHAHLVDQLNSAIAKHLSVKAP